jgi:hypothetical protein
LTAQADGTPYGQPESRHFRESKGGAPVDHFTTPDDGETLEPTKGRTRRRRGYGGRSRVTPPLAWRPALRPDRSPNDAR